MTSEPSALVGAITGLVAAIVTLLVINLPLALLYPDGWLYVEPASVLLFWLVGQIDPDVDAMRVGFPYVMPLVMQKRAAQRSTNGTPEPS